MSRAADYLKIEELYQAGFDLIYGPAHTQDINPDGIRRNNDRIFSMGKAVGRRDALDELAYPTELDDLRRFVKEARRIADAAPVRDLRKLVDLFDKHDRDETRAHRGGFEDDRINQWLAIVDGDVPRETKEN